VWGEQGRESEGVIEEVEWLEGLAWSILSHFFAKVVVWVKRKGESNERGAQRKEQGQGEPSGHAPSAWSRVAKSKKRLKDIFSQRACLDDSFAFLLGDKWLKKGGHRTSS
jgi:hypothetical protein